MKITDLEKFAVEHLFRPYCATYDSRIWELEYKQNDRISANKLQSKYERQIKANISVLIDWFESNKEFKECVFKRLGAIDKTDKICFPVYIQHPLKDYVIKELEEQNDNN